MNIGVNLYKKALGLKSILQSKPFTSMPEKLIFNSGCDYTMFSTKTGKKLGYMRAYITDWPRSRMFYPHIKHNYKCLYIDGLEVEEKNHGVGKTFIEFAKNISRNSEAEGRINILAWCLDDSKICPQVFYHKMGFTTANKKHLKEIERLEKLNDKAPKLFNNWNVSTQMYLEL